LKHWFKSCVQKFRFSYLPFHRSLSKFYKMFFWTSALLLKQERLKQAETKLLQLAREFGDRNAYEYKISTLDTLIPRAVIPFRNKDANNNEYLTIHAVKVESINGSSDDKLTTRTPLVMMHGYMNAAAYFYRNLVGLTHYFETVYSLDMLGWGLSSRPDFDLQLTAGGNDEASREKDEIKVAESFFVESLEAWRSKNKIDKMILAGHSMGGYMSVAYCEKYPQHVERLILLSPVGVPEESPDVLQRREAMRKSSWKVWAMTGVAQNIFQYHSAGQVFRSMPISWGENMCLNYVQKRLPAISDPDEQTAVAEYLIANNTLPGSGEHCINKVLTPFAMAKSPLEFRIPHLRVPSITFLYGQHDWMDPRGGVTVQSKCQSEQQPVNEQAILPKDVSVYQISKAGHLLMLENWREFNTAVILGGGGSLECLPGRTVVPEQLNPLDFVSDQSSSAQPQRSESQEEQRTSISQPSLKPQLSRTASLSDASTASNTEPQMAN